VAIDARWDGRDDDFDREERYKRLKFGYISAPAEEETSIGIHSSVDDGSFADLGDIQVRLVGGKLEPSGDFKLFPSGTTAVLAGSGSSEFRFKHESGGGKVLGKTLRHSIRHNELGKQPTVNGYTVHFKERTLR
jgi:hypothetical protein